MQSGLLASAIFALFLSACVPLAPPALEAPADAPAVAAPLAEETFISNEGGYAITLPDGWQPFSFRDMDSGALLDALQAQAATPEVAAIAESYGWANDWASDWAKDGAPLHDLVALGPISDDLGSPFVLTTAAVERNGMTLAHYLETIQTALPEGAAIEQATLAYGEVASDDLIAHLWFTYPTDAEPSSATTYRQYARLSANGDMLLLLNFSYPASLADVAAAEVDTILRSWQLLP